MVAIGVSRAGIGWVLLAGGMAIALGVLLIWQRERLPLFEGASSPEPVEAPSARAALVVTRRRQAESQAENAATDCAVA